MCLILVAWQKLAAHPLVVAANRDEFHARPAAPAAFWREEPSILAGRDLEAKGTWMGVSRGGRFAAVTNYRGAREPSAAESRGALVARFLASREPPQRYVGGLMGERYSGFNLLAADDEELWWTSNRDGSPRRLEAGIYGLGNALLDSPDVEAAKARFTQAVDLPAVDVLFDLLAKSMIVNPQYGTRCATVLLKAKDGRVRYAERSFSPEGAEQDTVQFAFSAENRGQSPKLSEALGL
jgi:uncharacterized protein with NRDE domain